MKTQTTNSEDESFSEYMNKHGLYQKPVYELQVAIDYIRSEYLPEDIFTDEQLQAWANKVGYVYP